MEVQGSSVITMEVDQNLQASSSSLFLKQGDENRNSTNPRGKSSQGDKERLEPVHVKENEKTEPHDLGNSFIEGQGDETAQEETFPSRAHEDMPVSGVLCLEEFDTVDIDHGYSSADEQPEGTAREVDINLLQQALRAISVSRVCSDVEAQNDSLENSCIDERQGETARQDDAHVIPEAPKFLESEPPGVEITVRALPSSNVFLPPLPGDVPCPLPLADSSLKV